MSRQLLQHILSTTQTIAVVGLSPKPERASNEVAEYLQAQGYRIIPINPELHAQQLLGEVCFGSLREAANALSPLGIRIDLVNCFRKSEDIPPIAEEAIAIGARYLWMQSGIHHQEAARQAEGAGLSVVQDSCIKTVHKQLFSGKKPTHTA